MMKIRKASQTPMLSSSMANRKPKQIQLRTLSTHSGTFLQILMFLMAKTRTLALRFLIMTDLDAISRLENLTWTWESY